MSKLSLLAVSAVLLARPMAAQTTIYTTFGPGDSHAGVNVGYVLGGSSLQWLAVPFTYGGASGELLFDFRVAMNSAAMISASFWQGASMTGATQLEAWAPTAVGDLSIVTFTSVLNPALTSGQKYWVMLAAGVTENAGWNRNALGLSGPVDVSHNGGVNWGAATILLPALDVSIVDEPTSTVPEPATMTLLATGMAGLAAARRRKQR